MVGDLPFEEIVTACSVYLEGGAKEVQVFYSTEDRYGNKKVIEFTVVQEGGKVKDETPGKSDKRVWTANPYS